MGVLGSACTIGCGGSRLEGVGLAIYCIVLVDALCEKVPAIRFDVR